MVRDLKVGDKVRISRYKRKTFDKGYNPNTTEEVFVIVEIQWTNPITCKIRDLNGELIKEARKSFHFRHTRFTNSFPNTV